MSRMRPITPPYVPVAGDRRGPPAAEEPGMPPLDDWIAEPAVRTHLSAIARAPASRLWAAGNSVRLSDTRTLGHLVRWRIPGLYAEQTFDAMFRDYPFALLGEGAQWAVSGLCGRIWTFARDYPELRGDADFRAWDEPGTVRVLFAHWAVDLGDGTSELHSEERIEPIDERAAKRLRALWRVVGPLKDAISMEPLPIAVARAERDEQRAASGD
jgi:hypothetical protein